MSLLIGTRRALLGAVAPAFSPLDIAGLQLWLKADAGLWQDSVGGTPAASDADVVGVWEDQSGNSNDASQATTSKKPLLKLAIQNGRDVVRFDGADDYLSLTGMTVASGPLTLAFVIKPTDNHAYNYLFDTETGRFLCGSNTLDRIGYHDGVWKVTAVSTTNWQVLTFVLEAAGGELFRNAGSISTDTYTEQAIGDRVAIGGDMSGSGGPYFGDIAELLIYNTALSAANRALVEAYLNTRYAVY